MKKIVIGATMLLVISLLVLLLPACAKPAPPAEKPAPPPVEKPAPPEVGIYPSVKAGVAMPEFMTLLGGGSETSLYTINAKCVEKRVREHWPQISIRTELSAIATSLHRLEKGEADWCVGLLPVPVEALKGGTERFPEPLTVFRTLCNFPEVMVQMMYTVEGTGITDLSQLRGKRIGVGPAGSTTVMLFEKTLKQCYGFDYEDIKAAGGTIYTGGWSEIGELVAAGDLEAGICGSPRPAAELIKLAATKKVRFLNLPPDFDDKVKEAGALRGCIAAGTYDWQKEPAYGFSHCMAYFVPATIPDDVAYNLLAAFYENDAADYRALKPHHAEMDLVTVNIKGNLERWVPAHPGAKKFWAEVEQRMGK